MIDTFGGGKSIKVPECFRNDVECYRMRRHESVEEWDIKIVSW